MSRRKKFTGYMYLITNMVNGKKYVGQTLRDINDRWKEHKSELNRGKHINKHLQSAWNKYGEENFKFEVLHKLQFSNLDTLQEALNDLEVMYISMWNLLDDKYGYNISSGGSNGNPYAGKTEEEMKLIRKKLSEAKKGKKRSKETKQKISEAHKGYKNYKAKKVAQYHINGEYIKTWNCIADAERELGVYSASITDCCKGKHRTSGGYRWAYVENDNIPVLSPLPTNYKGKNEPRPIAMINKETGEILKVFNSVVEANLYLGKPIDRDNISACARGINKTSWGYKWKYITQEQIQEKEAI